MYKTFDNWLMESVESTCKVRNARFTLYTQNFLNTKIASSEDFHFKQMMQLLSEFHNILFFHQYLSKILVDLSHPYFFVIVEYSINRKITEKYLYKADKQQQQPKSLKGSKMLDIAVSEKTVCRIVH